MKLLTWIGGNKAKTAAAISIGSVALVAAMALSFHLSPLSWGWYQPFDTSSGLALDGYDPVAYHTINEPRKGNDTITLQWKDAEWHFTSLENRALFESDPERYAPRYGAHCARAVRNNRTATSNPNIWHMEEGKLYVFGKQRAKEQWVTEISNGIIKISDTRWADGRSS